MSWPLSQDYNEAIQSPRGSFTDDELRNAEPILNALGIPLPCSGNFADVYPMRSARGSWAVKCFTREVPGLRERYAAISRCLRGVNLPFAVDFTFLEQGIRVRGQWYPVLKMQWVEGLTLNAFVRQYADKPATMKTLLQIWVRMAARLREAGIAHADLQHGNVLLVPGSTANSLAVKLIDYDGMWIPALAKTPSGEVGHPCYQHPRRASERIYSQELDRFPLLLVATALDCLRVGGQALWEKYDSGDNLLFRETDLQAPTKSPLFHELLKLGDGRASNLVRHTFDALKGRLESAPLLAEVLPELYAAPASKPASKPTTVVKMAVGQPAAEAASASASAWDFGDEAKESPRRPRKRGTPRWVWGVAGAGVAALVLAGVIFALAFRGGSGKPKDEERITQNPPAIPPQRPDKSSEEAPKKEQPNGDGEQPSESPGADPPSAAEGEVLTPAQAAGKNGQKVTVQFHVQQTGVNGEEFTELFSEEAWDRAGNYFFLRFPESTRKKFQELGVSDVGRHFYGKLIRVTGTVTFFLFRDVSYPCIVIDDPGQISIPDLRTDGFVSPFNGKDLEGWDGLMKYWSVKDGGIVGYMPEDAKQSTFLCSKKKYSDFELQFKVRLKDGVGNSGVQIRSNVIDKERFVVGGPQADIDGNFWGSLYGERLLKRSPKELVERTVKPEDFNDYYIKCIDKHVTIKINGETMVDDNFPTLPEEGIIAFQLYAGSKSMEVTFKDIKFTDLSKPRAEPPPATQVAAEEKGFVRLFNDEDLTGWRVESGDAKQWTVQENTIVARSADWRNRSYLLSTRECADFTLRLEFMIEPGGKGGIAIRAFEGEKRPLEDGQFALWHPIVKLTDPDKFPNVPSGTTNWVKDDKQFCKPVGDPHLRAGEWHRMEITVRGDKCTATIDDKQLIDLALDASASAKSPFVPALKRKKGKIGLQIHTGTIRFRNVAIKELPAESLPSRAQDDHPPDAKDGFVPLFNGTELSFRSNWRTHPTQPGNWRVEKGVLIGSGPATSHLYTKRGDYKDFHLRVEAKINDGGNSGIYSRAVFGPYFPKAEPRFPDGYEAKIHNGKSGDPGQTGSLFVTPARPGEGVVVRSVRESPIRPEKWFRLEVNAEGNHIVIKVNGKTTADYTDDERRFLSGYIALKQLGSDTVEFRKIEIKELPAKAADSSSSRAQDDHPPDAKEAAVKAYKKACADARAKLLAAFDAEVDKLAKQTGSAEARLKRIDILKEEKRRFENRGWIPWSAWMRLHVDRYLATLKAAQARLRGAYDSLISAQLRAKNESKVAELRADLKYRLDVKVMAKWNFFINGRLHRTMVLYSNGAADNIDGKATWSYGNGVLYCRFPDPNGPGGAWMPTVKVSLDGTTYEGTNNDRPERRPKLTGTYVKDD